MRHDRGAMAQAMAMPAGDTSMTRNTVQISRYPVGAL